MNREIIVWIILATFEVYAVLLTNDITLMNRIFKLLLVFTTFLLIAFQTENQRHAHSSIGTETTLKYYRIHAKEFAATTNQLEEHIKGLTADTLSRKSALKQLTACRMAYKKIAFFTSYFFSSETRMINAAPVVEVEEPTLEFVEAMGMQAIENLLFDNNYLQNKEELLLQTQLLNSAASQLTTLLYNFQLTDAQILESQRIDLIRVMTLSISGYDAPELKTGVKEAVVSLETMQIVLRPYQDAFGGHTSIELSQRLGSAITFLQQNSNFNTFDRLQFLRLHALPLQISLSEAIHEWNLELNTQKYLHYDSPHLFSKGAIQMQPALQNTQVIGERIALGKQLFSNTALSGNGMRSCATCHLPESFFNDNLVRSASIQLDTILKRNTPTLLYTGAQHLQFWDGRAASLEDQIVQVIFNPLEMNGSADKISHEILNNREYRLSFGKAFPEQQEMTIQEIAKALASFVGTLQPNSSAFDQYISGDLDALTAREINGFNVFMGKAQCGTCHFLPYFNGLLPPHYDVSEVEILGSPENDNLENPIKDTDRGRYDLYKVRYYDGAFKTPTVRNAAKTAPYMHNGAFKTLMEVVEFYDRGGGVGLGLNIPEQTLSVKTLNLTTTEKEDICLFIESLTDKI